MQLFDILVQNEYYKKLAESVRGGRAPAAVFGATPFVGALFAAAHARDTKKPVLAIFPTDGEASRAAEDLERLSVGACGFISRDLVLIDVDSASREAEQARLLALGSLIRGEAEVVCASASAALQPAIPRAELIRNSFTLRRGQSVRIEDLSQKLCNCGFARRQEVEASGQFAVRGGIVDIFPCTSELPARIDFFGDTVEEIFSIDPDTQRRAAPLEEIFISPVCEILLPAGFEAQIEGLLSGRIPEKLREIAARDAQLFSSGAEPPSADRYMPLLWEQPQTLFDFMEGSAVFLCGASGVNESVKQDIFRAGQDLGALAESGLITKSMYGYFMPRRIPEGRVSAMFEAFTRDLGSPISEIINLKGCSELRWGGDIRQFREDAKGYYSEGYRVAVLAGTRRAAKSLCGDLENEGLPAAQTAEASFQDGCISVCPASLSRGFLIPALKLCAISSVKREGDAVRRRSYKKSGRGIGSLSDLSQGDYVVHVNHGVGVYAGIKTIDFHGTIKDYITIRYQGGDLLYVPVTQLDMVSLYTAPSDQKAPPVGRLNSGDWQRTRQKVYRSARDMAKELISLYARRQQERGVEFPEDGEWQRDFESRFEYDETPDQSRSADEVKRDMESPRPMDRLLCGDVGVGKTEVAMRAAFKCIDGGYQCALLVPTTILAWQHYQSFCERFEGFPVKVVMLSRFSTKAQIADAVRSIKSGEADIAIGTHRLLQNDVEFKKLGLLIIDEEQRFGVAHKEKLKQAAAGVDVLTLSATPIPRTLSMALGGIRDMSVIEQPPVGRQPVQTYVVEYDEGVVVDAIRRELSRAGQVYYLHNHVETIERCAEKLRSMLPDARIEAAHGRMSEAELSSVWGRLINNECDILVCTTIIETGVDVPNCNTLIVENADNMGLSQLYQLRGRVGRSSRRAYAYFTFRRDSVLTEVASKRLSAIRDFTGFGSGYKIAMRDLQIRGAGSLLNASQSGHMHSVGYDMYLKILEEAIGDEKGTARPAVSDCLVDITVDAHLPESYIQSPAARIEMYKRIAGVDSEEAARDVAEEFRDRFGEPPQSVSDLIAVSLIRTAAARCGFYEIKSRGSDIYLYSDLLDPAALREYTNRKLRPIGVQLKGKSCVTIRAEGESPAKAVRELLSNLEAISLELKKVDN